MKLFELVSTDNLSNYDVNKDEINTHRRDDTRKDRLMLRDINELKKIRALKKLDSLKKQDVLSVMYGGGSGGDDGFGGGF